MAGDEAVREFLELSTDQADLDYTTPADLDDIANLVADPDAEIPNGSWKRYEPRFRRQTRRLVRKHRAKIKAVAVALLRSHQLTAKEIDREMLSLR